MGYVSEYLLIEPLFAIKGRYSIVRGVMAESLLHQVASEWTRSTGLGGEEVNAQRQRALNYYKGNVDDVIAPEKRSRAVSMDVAEAIDSFMPDAIEIFTGSDDVVTFEPVGPEDVEAAAQETDYINHVFFKENDGFLILHDMVKDACLTKTGVVKVSWRTYDTPDETFTGQSLDALALAVSQYGERIELAKGFDLSDPTIEAFDYTIKGEKVGKACVECVPPEDFGVSEDTVRLKDSPYHWHRTRVRAYELLNRGISRKLVEKLPAYGVMDSDLSTARSIAGETPSDVGGDGDQRIVEVIEHYLLTSKGRKRVLTDATVGVELDKDDHDYVCFAAMTPYPVAHQFYGESIADKLVEIQRIKTVLTRMALDSGNFALNQRMAIDMTKAHEWTMRDLLSNEPNRPVRVKGPVREAVQPLTSGGLSFDAFGALEYMSVQGEQRSGVMRNAQGLKPDTLHDTASGAMALLNNAQKRTRMVCRVFAETGIKDMFLILHRVIRENADRSARVRLRNKWVEIDPTSWGSRNDMTVEVGVGSGGKEQTALMYRTGWEAMQGLITLQGGPSGPLVTPENIYAFAKQAFEKGLGFRSADEFISNPTEAEPQEPQPDPAMLEMQAKQQMAQMQIEADREKAGAQIETERMKASAHLDLEREKAAANMQLEREKADLKMQIDRERAAMEAELARERAVMEGQLELMRIESQERSAEAKMRTNRPGGDLDK